MSPVRSILLGIQKHSRIWLYSCNAQANWGLSKIMRFVVFPPQSWILSSVAVASNNGDRCNVCIENKLKIQLLYCRSVNDKIGKKSLHETMKTTYQDIMSRRKETLRAMDDALDNADRRLADKLEAKAAMLMTQAMQLKEEITPDVAMSVI